MHGSKLDILWSAPADDYLIPIGAVVADPPSKKSIVGITCCCARGASGYATAVPPSSVMNLRRLITCPWVRIEPYHIIEYEQRCALQQNWPPMSLVGQNRRLPQRSSWWPLHLYHRASGVLRSWRG
jgi:hypothetical protein